MPKTTRTSNWYTGGENASAACLPPDSDHCDFEVGYASLRKVQLAAEDHVARTGHSVQVERAMFRVVVPITED
jgi:hypothetical protein